MKETEGKKWIKIIFIIVLWGGIVTVLFSVIDIIKDRYETKGYKSIEGIVTGMKVKSNDVGIGIADISRNHKGWEVEVAYEIDGEKYTVVSRFLEDKRPELGSTRVVKYNPDNPQEAVIKGKKYYVGFAIGGFFILIALVCMSVFGNLWENTSISGIFVGLVFVSGGSLFIYDVGNDVNTHNVWKLFKMNPVFILLLLLFVVIGLIIMAASIFGWGIVKFQEMKLISIEQIETSKIRFLFEAETPKEAWLKNAILYSTDIPELFMNSIGERYNVNVGKLNQRQTEELGKMQYAVILNGLDIDDFQKIE